MILPVPADARVPSLARRAKLLRGIADPSRLTLLTALRDGALSVGELVGRTGLSQSNVSNHLACLLDCGLVSREPRGRRVIYRLSDGRVDALLALLDELVADVALDCARLGPAEGSEAP